MSVIVVVLLVVIPTRLGHGLAVVGNDIVGVAVFVRGLAVVDVASDTQWLEETLNTKDVWFARLDQIADHLDGLVARGEYTPRVEKLPYYSGPQGR